MYYLYYLICSKTYVVEGKRDTIYVGVSKNPRLRFNSHKHSARQGVDRPLYNCMKGHSFLVITLKGYSSKEEAYRDEIKYISILRTKDDIHVLNVADGGLGGYVIPEHKKEGWKAKLSKARQGAKPALGMKHTEENKRVFSEVSTKYWNECRKYHWWDIKDMSCKEAMITLGISKTHYYRLLKQAKVNALS